MGERVSVSFRTDGEESVTLSDHWGYLDRPRHALEYAQQLMRERSGQMMPLDRFEPDAVMVDYIREITSGVRRVESGFRVVASPDQCDNSDWGHYIIEFVPVTRTVRVYHRERNIRTWTLTDPVEVEAIEEEAS